MNIPNIMLMISERSANSIARSLRKDKRLIKNEMWYFFILLLFLAAVFYLSPYELLIDEEDD